MFTVLAAALVLGAAGTASGAEYEGTDRSRVVEYRGLGIQVPGHWRVVDLRRTPNACVEFGQPTVYLGRSGEQRNCPARAVGGAPGLQLEPRKNATIVPDQPGARNLVEKSAGVLVRVIEPPNARAEVRAILRTVRLTADDERANLDRPEQVRATQATTVVTPGDYTGRGFDTCASLTDNQMNTWWEHSPYRVVGIYYSGPQRYCPHTNVDAAWIERHSAKGWKFIPIEVGRQAPCTDYANRMSSDPATARAQGAEAAEYAVDNAQAIGIGPGSALYNDIEAYSRGGSCTAAVLSYTSGWTDKLHELGYLSGFYSSAASGVADQVAAYNDSNYSRVDHLWFAWWNNQANVDGGQYIPDNYWPDRQRLHQYSGEVTESYGGVSMAIDGDYLDVASSEADCTAARLDYGAYETIQSGDSGPRVLAAQCLLERNGHDLGEPDGSFGETTVAAVEAFQSEQGLPSDGVVDSHTWTALLSAGGTRQVSNGSVGDPVFRLQRALTSALGRSIGIDGYFGANTKAAVEEYQSGRDLGADGIVGPNTWAALQSGK